MQTSPPSSDTEQGPLPGALHCSQVVMNHQIHETLPILNLFLSLQKPTSQNHFQNPNPILFWAFTAMLAHPKSWRQHCEPGIGTKLTYTATWKPCVKKNFSWDPRKGARNSCVLHVYRSCSEYLHEMLSLFECLECEGTYCCAMCGRKNPLRAIHFMPNIWYLRPAMTEAGARVNRVVAVADPSRETCLCG